MPITWSKDTKPKEKTDWTKVPMIHDLDDTAAPTTPPTPTTPRAPVPPSSNKDIPREEHLLRRKLITDIRAEGTEPHRFSTKDVKESYERTMDALPLSFSNPINHTVLGRITAMDASTLMSYSPEAPYVVVSIADLPPDGIDIRVPRRRNCKGVLYLQIHPIDPDTMPRKEFYRYNGRTAEQCSLTPSVLKKLEDFLRRHIGKDIVELILQCPDGRNRSLSLALGITHGLGLSPSRITLMVKNTPTPFAEPDNRFIFRTISGFMSGLYKSDLVFKKPSAPPAVKGPLPTVDHDFPLGKDPESRQDVLNEAYRLTPDATPESRTALKDENERLK